MTEHVELIREAARVIRQRAEAATKGPWAIGTATSVIGAEGAKPKLSGHVVCSVGAHDRIVPSHADAEHIASWHPGVALLVADWLDTGADPYWCVLRAPMVAFARAYLGRTDD